MLSHAVPPHEICFRATPFPYPGGMGARRTRMMGMQGLLAPHAPLEASYSESKCSPILRPPHALSPRMLHFHDSQ